MNVLPLRSVGVAKEGNVGGQAIPQPQEIHTGFDPRGSGTDDLGNQCIPLSYLLLLALRFKRRLTYLATLFKKGYRTTPLHSMLLELLEVTLGALVLMIYETKVFLFHIFYSCNFSQLFSFFTDAEVANDAPMNRNDYEIDGGNDHSHDGGHPSTITVLSIEKIFPSFFLFIFLSIFSLTPYNEVDVENHEEPGFHIISKERSVVCQAMVDQLPTHVDLFCVEGLNDDQLMDW
ncbi:hypothetical protein Tco_0048934, partial [Tanacetum coccineum]